MWYDTTKKLQIEAQLPTRLDVGDINKPPCVGIAANPVTAQCRFWNPVVISAPNAAGITTVRTVQCCHNPRGQEKDFSCHTP